MARQEPNPRVYARIKKPRVKYVPIGHVVVASNYEHANRILRDHEAMEALRDSIEEGDPITLDACVWVKGRWTQWEAERSSGLIRDVPRQVPFYDDPADAILATADQVVHHVDTTISEDD